MSENRAVPVNNFLKIKSIKDNPEEEGGLLLIGTCIQTINKPEGLDTKKDGFEDKNGRFFFSYRINEEVADKSNGFMKVCGVDKNESITSTSFAVRAPLEIESVFDHFPFKLSKASLTVELCTKSDQESSNRLRPDLHLDMRHRRANVAIQHQQGETKTTKILEKMDRTKKYDFITPYPEVYYERNDDDPRAKFVISFYLVEFGAEKFLPVVLPLFLIFFMNLINVSFNSAQGDSLDYLANSATLALAMVFLVENINTGETASVFTSLIFISLMLCSIPEGFFMNVTNTSKLLAFVFRNNYCLPAQIGCWIFGSALFIPLINFFRFKCECRSIRDRCPPKKDFIDKKGETKLFKPFEDDFKERFSSLISEKVQELQKKGYDIDFVGEKNLLIHYCKSSIRNEANRHIYGETV